MCKWSLVCQTVGCSPMALGVNNAFPGANIVNIVIMHHKTVNSQFWV